MYTEKLGGLLRGFLGDLRLGREGVGAGRGEERETVRVLDLCTGTGCIPLLLYQILKRKQSERDMRMASSVSSSTNDPFFRVVGVDNSPAAITLARENLTHNMTLDNLPAEASTAISFLHADILQPLQDLIPMLSNAFRISSHTQTQTQTQTHNTPEARLSPRIDILTANPPYIPPSHLYTLTARSVRVFEPRSALIPPTPLKPLISPSESPSCPRGDEFFHAIVPLARELDVGCMLLEVGDSEQGRRVARLAAEEGKETGGLVELWDDDGTVWNWDGGDGKGLGEGSERSERSEGDEERASVRAVVVWRREWAEWRKGHGGLT